MKQIHSRLLPLFAFCLFLVACNRDTDEEAKSAAANAGEAPTNRVDIPTTVRNNLGITFAKVERRSVSTTIRVPGSFELEPLAMHEYRLMLPGRVEFVIDHLSEVKPGTVLYKFRSPEWLELQAQIDLAKASLDQALTKYETAEARIKALKKAEFKRADLDAQGAELSADVTKRKAELQAALNNAARTLNIHGVSGTAGITPDDLLEVVDKQGKSMPFYQTIDSIEVRAAEPGFVKSLAVTNGAFVEKATLLLTTIDPSKVRFHALGLQSDLASFESGQQVRIVPPQASGSDINESIEAKLTVGLTADPKQRTITLFAQPKELRPWIRPGVSAFLEVAVDTTGSVVLAIPRSAVVKDGITHVFFKRDPSNANKAIRVEADLGVDDGRWVEVKSELGPNDEVVFDGAYELKLATSQSGSAQKGGHFHADGTYHAEEE